MAPTSDYNKFNARGGVTYSSLTMPHAVAANERSSFPKDADKIAPEVQLLLDQTQAERLVKHLTETFVPECVKRFEAGEKRDILEPKIANKIYKALESGFDEGWEVAPPHLPIKKVYSKTQLIAPWAVGTLKFTGTAGRDIDQQARVQSEADLLVPDPDQLVFPVLRPIGQTKHELYPGAWAFATLKLQAWTSSASNFGISAYGDTLVFLEDRDRLGGGFGLDEEDVFMDE